MRLVYRLLGAEIVLVQVGHGLVGAALLGIVAANVPLWFFAALTPLAVFSLAYWMMEARFVMPVARQLLGGGPGVAQQTAHRAESRRRRDQEGEEKECRS